MWRKINHDLLSQRKQSITPELNMAYKHLSFLEGESPKLLFADDLYQRSGYQRAN